MRPVNIVLFIGNKLSLRHTLSPPASMPPCGCRIFDMLLIINKKQQSYGFTVSFGSSEEPQ